MQHHTTNFVTENMEDVRGDIREVTATDGKNNLANNVKNSF